jgi:hypothetical protein
VNEISDEVVKKINSWLQIEKESCIRVRSDGDTCKIGLVSEEFLDETRTIYPTNEFYKALEEFLCKECNIVDIKYNNTWTTFWKHKTEVTT